MRLLAYNAGSGELLANALRDSVLRGPDGDDDDVAAAPPRLEITAYAERRSFTDPLPALTDLQASRGGPAGSRRALVPDPAAGLSVRPDERLATDPVRRSPRRGQPTSRRSRAGGAGEADRPGRWPPRSATCSPRPPTSASAAVGEHLANRPRRARRNRDGAADAVEAHRAYQSGARGPPRAAGRIGGATASLGPQELAALRAAHERADWVLTLDRNVGIDLYTSLADGTYILDYAPDFLEGLGPRLTVTTAHRGEVQRLLADAMGELELAAVTTRCGSFSTTCRWSPDGWRCA